MAYDKAVDSAALDSGLTTIADAIRAKGGTAEPLEFPQGMADAVTAIPSGDNLGKHIREITGATFYDQVVSVNAPNCQLLSKSAFYGFKQLEFVNVESVLTVNSRAFEGCEKLKNLNIENCETIGSAALGGCAIKTLNLKKSPLIMDYAFGNCQDLSAVIIRGSNVSELFAVNAFNNTPILTGSGYIYAPKALVEQYKTATNWVAVATQIRAIEDYPEITGGAV